MGAVGLILGISRYRQSLPTVTARCWLIVAAAAASQLHRRLGSAAGPRRWRARVSHRQQPGGMSRVAGTPVPCGGRTGAAISRGFRGR